MKHSLAKSAGSAWPACNCRGAIWRGPGATCRMAGDGPERIMGRRRRTHHRRWCGARHWGRGRAHHRCGTTTAAATDSRTAAAAKSSASTAATTTTSHALGVTPVAKANAIASDDTAMRNPTWNMANSSTPPLKGPFRSFNAAGWRIVRSVRHRRAVQNRFVRTTRGLLEVAGCLATQWRRHRREIVGYFNVRSSRIIAMQVLVVGAGVVGLGIARAVARAGHEVIVAEAESAIGTVTSSRNSEVIHAGLYYPTNSIARAALPAQPPHALRLLRGARRSAPQDRQDRGGDRTTSELEQLDEIYKQAQINGCENVELIDAAAVKKLEPEVFCLAAMNSPETGIIDSHRYMLALRGEIEDHGGVIALNTRIERLVQDAGRLGGAFRRRRDHRRRCGGQRRRARRAEARAAPPKAIRRSGCRSSRSRRATTSAIPAGRCSSGWSIRRRSPAGSASTSCSISPAACASAPTSSGSTQENYDVDPAPRATSFYASIRELLAGAAGQLADPGLCRHPPEDQRAGRAGARLHHRRAEGPRRAAAGDAVRHRVAGADLVAVDRRGSRGLLN